jgi:TRAP-type C4-dicarboxylate transport system permease small subunit
VSLSSEFNQVSAALGVPLGAVYSVLPISGAIVLFYSGLQAIEISGRWRAWGGEG